jgi:acyl-coenzyme A thioesterase PaaI-like protein
MSIDYASLPAVAEPLTTEQQRQSRQAVRDVMLTTPFIGGLGVVFERYEPDLPVSSHHSAAVPGTNDGIYFHGGVIVSVMDTAGAAAAWSNHDFDKGMRAATVAMSIQYTGAAKRCDLLCHARTTRRRKELTFTEITATDAGGNVGAHAVQTYRIV